MPPRPPELNPHIHRIVKIPEILNVVLKLRNRGYSKSTLNGKSIALKLLAKHSSALSRINIFSSLQTL